VPGNRKNVSFAARKMRINVTEPERTVDDLWECGEKSQIGPKFPKNGLAKKWRDWDQQLPESGGHSAS